jgi:hypothetical protein
MKTNNPTRVAALLGALALATWAICPTVAAEPPPPVQMDEDPDVDPDAASDNAAWIDGLNGMQDSQVAAPDSKDVYVPEKFDGLYENEVDAGQASQDRASQLNYKLMEQKHHEDEEDEEDEE